MQQKRDYYPVKLMGSIGFGFLIVFVIAAIVEESPKLVLAGLSLFLMYIVAGLLMSR